MPSAIELAHGDEKLIAAVHRSRRLIGRKALMAAAASAIPLPGIDWAADAALLSRLVPQISAEFGLSVTQVEKLAPHQRERIQKAATTVGALLVGRLVTRDLLIRLAKPRRRAPDGQAGHQVRADRRAAGVRRARLRGPARPGRAAHQGLRARQRHSRSRASRSTFTSSA
jgi:hypothetical protein